MQICASKFIYHEDLENLGEVLAPFKNLPVQLSFFEKRDFLLLDHDLIKKTSISLNISIISVHAPTVDVFHQEFLPIIEMIKKTYNNNLITIHPQKGEGIVALTKLKECGSLLQNMKVILAYENFPSSVSKRKWIYLPKEMCMKFDESFLRLTFDTSHLDNPSDCIEEFETVADKVAVVHLSDSDGRNQHQPLGTGNVPYKAFLRYLQNYNFQGPVVIEYMGEFQDKLIKDVRDLISEFSA